MVTLKRPKQVQTEDVTLSLAASLDTLDGEFFVKVTTPVTPEEFDVTSCNVDIETKTLSHDSTTAFENVRVGDVVSGDSIAEGSVVTAIAEDEVTLDLAPTADITDDSETITFTPPEVDGTLFVVKMTPRASNNNMDLRVTVANMNGTKVYDAGEGADAATFVDGIRTKTMSSALLDGDLFLANARIARS
jgi:hypothetical protein